MNQLGEYVDGRIELSARGWFDDSSGATKKAGDLLPEIRSMFTTFSVSAIQKILSRSQNVA